MNFKKSVYYNIKFLGRYFYEDVNDSDEIFTVQEFFNINNVKNEYHIENEYGNHRLIIKNDYYELDCQKYNSYLFLVFDKPVHITGEYCDRIIAPEIIIKSEKNSAIYYCVTDKLIVNNDYQYSYDINFSKCKNVYFYNEEVSLNENEIYNFFILNEYLVFDSDSSFLDYHKIKCFGSCESLKKKTLNNQKLKQGIIHIE